MHLTDTQRIFTCIVSKVLVLDDVLLGVTIMKDTNTGERCIRLRAKIRIAVNNGMSHKSAFRSLSLPLDHLTYGYTVHTHGRETVVKLTDVFARYIKQVDNCT